nr:reverse transcriptase domain-containing protein [Tanacetum cinerariifolium]
MKQHNRRRSKQIVKPELQTIVETLVATMADTHTMLESLQAPTEGYRDAIVILAILSENFELKVGLLSLVTSSQFHGLERDDPHSHIPRTWLEKEPPRSIHTWEDLVSKFVNYFFPPLKITNLKNDIKIFQQRFDEMFNVTALTEIVKELLLMNKATQQATVKAIKETCVTCGGPHPYYECLATGGNTFDACAAVGRYNKGGFNQQKEKNFNQGNNNYQTSNNQAPIRPSNDFMKTNDVNLRAMKNQISNMKTELKNEFQTTMKNKNNKLKNMMINDLKNMMSRFIQMQSPSGLGSLPSNTVANPRGNLKAISTQSGVAYKGPVIPPTSSSLPKEVEQESKVTKGKVQTTSSESTAHVQSLVVQVPILEPDVASLHFDISFTDALLHMPKFASTFKSLLKAFTPGTYSYSHDAQARKLIVDYDVDPRVPLILGRPFLRTTGTLIDVYSEELTLRVNDEAITFKVRHISRYSCNYYKESVNQINLIDVTCEEYAQEVLGFSDSSTSGNPTPSDPIIASSSPSFVPFEGGDFILEEIEIFLHTPNELSNLDDEYYNTEGDILYLEKLLNEDLSLNLPLMKNENLKQVNVTMPKPSIEEPPELELKDLPSPLEYAFLEGTDKLPVIISKELKDKEKAALLKVLKSQKRAIAWKISDIKGIEPRFCTHKILMEDDFIPAVQHKRKVNPKILRLSKRKLSNSLMPN